MRKFLYVIPFFASLQPLSILQAQQPQQAQQEPRKCPTPANCVDRADRLERMQTAPVRTFRLKYAPQPNDGNEILTGIRLMVEPGTRIFLVPNQNAIMVRGLPEDIAVAEQIISEMDKPRITFRLSYAFNEYDGTQRVTSEHDTMTLVDGQRFTLRRGQKVPVGVRRDRPLSATSSSSATSSLSPTAGPPQQPAPVTYLDVGTRLDSTLNAIAGGAVLKTVVEQSGEVETQPVPDAPVIRQTILEGVTTLALGKSAIIGLLTIPGTTHRLEVEALIEKVP